MRTHQLTWLLSAGLLVIAGLATAGSTYVHWLPCRGTMLSGSILRGYAYAPDFSDACLQTMDGGLPFPFAVEATNAMPLAAVLGSAAVALAGVAWLVLVFGLRLPWRTTAFASLPGMATLVVFVVGLWAAGPAGPDLDGSATLYLQLAIDAAALVAALALLVWRPRLRDASLAGLMVALWGASAFSVVHVVSEYAAMGMFSDANWDLPPGTGYPTALVLVASGVLTALLVLRSPASKRPVADESGSRQQSHAV